MHATLYRHGYNSLNHFQPSWHQHQGSSNKYCVIKKEKEKKKENKTKTQHNAYRSMSHERLQKQAPDWSITKEKKTS